YGAAGFVFADWLGLIVLMILSGAVGTWLGLRLLRRLNDRRFTLIFNLLLTLLALRLVWQALLAGADSRSAPAYRSSRYSGRKTMSDDQPHSPAQEPAPPRDPFAHARPSEYYWIQLKPVYKGRLMLHGERLAQVAVTHERVASLELLRLELRIEEDSVPPGTN